MNFASSSAPLFPAVAAWSAILIAGVLTCFDAALKLDFYANGVVCLGFLAVGATLRPERRRTELTNQR